MDPTDLAFAGAARQAALLAGGSVSAVELTQLMLERIARLDPVLNAYRVVLGEEALAGAAAADERLAAGERLPLLGVPVAIKDDVALAGQATAHGTDAHAGPVAADGAVVAALRAAGAIPIGKTHVPELTMWPFTESLTFGATRNPWDRTRTPGGSSGGTGAAVAAGLAGLGLGSDGAGSIRIPASWCGLFGLKPQRGRVPLAPHDDAWNGLSVNGPLARTVADAALFLDATASGDRPAGGFAAAAGRAPGRLRIAVSSKLAPGQFTRMDPAHRGGLEATAALLEDLGHEVLERDPSFPADAFTALSVRYLNGIRTDAAALPHPERLERRTRAMARLGAAPAALVRAARRRERALAAAFQDVLTDHDVLLMPTTAKGPFRVGELEGRGALRTVLTSSARVPWLLPVNGAGLPAAAVPAGLDADGLPMGVQLIGRAWDEATLLSLSAQLEAARPWADRRPGMAA